MENTENIYDQQIKHLTQYPQNILFNWTSGNGLFKFIGGGNLDVGCPTLIRGGGKAYIKGKINEDLTNEIYNDERIPLKAEDIKVEHLPIFKYYQEKADALENA